MKSCYIVGTIILMIFLLNLIDCVDSRNIKQEAVSRDTILIVDTVRVEVPVPVHTVELESVPVPYLLTKLDTVFLTDTFYLPITQSVYRDSTYTAWVSGYMAKLDSIETYTPTMTIQVYKPPPRWGIGLQIGYGASRDGLSPYIGVGVSYDLFRIK